jgi:ADP-ribose pyrophosphatase YjhB (NUDIX family)
MTLNAIKSVAIIIFKGDEVLLVRNGRSSDYPTGKYGLPAGKVDKGESWEEAAARECFEESGLRPKKLVKLPTFYESDVERKEGKKHYCCWSFYCPEYEDELRTTDETEPVWVKINKIRELDLVVNVDRMIAEADVERKK